MKKKLSVPGSGIPRLRSIYLYLTKFCNLNCGHCWINPVFAKKDILPDNAGNIDVDINDIYKALSESKKLGLRSVRITGGEPFLRQEIFDLLKWLKKNGLVIQIETNGTLIGEKEAKAIRDNKVSTVAVSLDGPDSKIHERLRGVEGSFNRALRGIRNIRKYYPALELQVICSLWKGNKSKMPEMIDLCAGLGVSSLKINPVMSVSRAGSMKKKGDLLTVKETLRVIKSMKLHVLHKKLGDKLKMIYDIPPVFLTVEELRRDKCSCGIKSLLGIVGDGTISICGIGNTVKELSMGNIKNTSLKDVWLNNRILKDIRKNVPLKLEGVCGRCMMKHFCLGKCRAEAYWAKRSLYSPHTFCDAAEKENIFPRTRLLA